LQMVECFCTTLFYWLLGAAIVFLGLKWLRSFWRGGQFTEAVSAVGKVVVITGANTGIGLETARDLNLRGAKVYLLCRNEQRAKDAIADLVGSGCYAARLIYINCDLSSKANIRTSAAKLTELESAIDILINNGGLCVDAYQRTADGHEMTWGTNHIGTFLLTELLLPLIEKAPEGRIVNVASIGHERSTPIDLATIDAAVDYTTAKAYCRSKLANVLHARELTRRLRARGVTTVTVNSLHPGVVFTDICRDLPLHIKMIASLFIPFYKSPRDGAQTTLYCALSRALKGVSGEYFKDCARSRVAPLALDDLSALQLYDYSLKAVGL
ncbi:hypothetical protein PRIPAC_72014, partial [Pristionchus pacificus]